jgi:hypothetical protein
MCYTLSYFYSVLLKTVIPTAVISGSVADLEQFYRNGPNPVSRGHAVASNANFADSKDTIGGHR